MLKLFINPIFFLSIFLISCAPPNKVYDYPPTDRTLHITKVDSVFLQETETAVISEIFAIRDEKSLGWFAVVAAMQDDVLQIRNARTGKLISVSQLPFELVDSLFPILPDEKRVIERSVSPKNGSPFYARSRSVWSEEQQINMIQHRIVDVAICDSRRVILTAEIAGPIENETYYPNMFPMSRLGALIEYDIPSRRIVKVTGLSLRDKEYFFTKHYLNRKGTGFVMAPAGLE